MCCSPDTSILIWTIIFSSVTKIIIAATSQRNSVIELLRQIKANDNDNPLQLQKPVCKLFGILSVSLHTHNQYDCHVISETWISPDRKTNCESHRHEFSYINRKKRVEEDWL